MHYRKYAHSHLGGEVLVRQRDSGGISTALPQRRVELAHNVLATQGLVGLVGGYCAVEVSKVLDEGIVCKL